MHLLRTLGRIWLASWRYSLSRELMFRGNFILWILVEICWFVLQLIFVQVLYLHTDSIAGWSHWEMILLVGVSQLIQQLFQTFFLVNFINFSELVRNGKLDFYLLQPAPVLFLITTRLWDVGSVLNSGLALTTVVYAAHQISIPFTLHAWGSAAGLICSGIALHYAILLFLVTPAFWITRAEGAIPAYYQAFQVARQPREAFHGILRVLFSSILPLLLVSNLPARALIGGLGMRDVAVLLGTTALLLGLGIRFFYFGLRRYTSASS